MKHSVTWIDPEIYDKQKQDRVHEMIGRGQLPNSANRQRLGKRSGTPAAAVAERCVINMIVLDEIMRPMVSDHVLAKDLTTHLTKNPNINQVALIWHPFYQHKFHGSRL